MNLRHMYQDYPIHLPNQHSLSERQAYRRRVLGLLLIAVGGLLLYLRLNGWVGSIPLPISWGVGMLGLVVDLTSADLLVSIPLAACGMLAAYSTCRTR